MSSQVLFSDEEIRHLKIAANVEDSVDRNSISHATKDLFRAMRCLPYRAQATRWSRCRGQKVAIVTTDGKSLIFYVFEYYPGFARLTTRRASSAMHAMDWKRIGRLSAQASVGREFELTVMPDELPALASFAIRCVTDPNAQPEIYLDRPLGDYAWSQRASGVISCLNRAFDGRGISARGACKLLRSWETHKTESDECND